MDIYISSESCDPIKQFNHGDLYIKRECDPIKQFNHGDLCIKRELRSH
jgi:hypothetical protein